MMLGTIFQTLAEGVADVRERIGGAAFLKAIRAIDPHTAIEYLCLNLPAPRHPGHYINCYLSDATAKHFVSPAEVDASSFSRLIMANKKHATNQASHSHPAGSRLESYELGPQERHIAGNLLPVTSVHGELAAFCVSSEHIEGDVESDHPVSELDIDCIAGYFHNHVLSSYGHIRRKAPSVSRRELECLRWMAAGKTAWEASVILGISERTVRFHLNSVREKLDCATTTQAVARAVANQIIVL